MSILVPVVSKGVTLNELPDKIAVYFEIGECVRGCKGCHSPHLQVPVPHKMTLEEMCNYAELQIERGANSLVLMGGTGGIVAMTGAVGGTVALTSLSVSTNNSIVQGSSVKTTGAISYTGTTPTISLAGNLTINGNTIDIGGPATLTENVVADTTYAGVSPAGAGITFSDTVNGPFSLSALAGTGKKDRIS